MGFNTHILSGRNASPNLDAHAAGAASFNPSFLANASETLALSLASRGRGIAFAYFAQGDLRISDYSSRVVAGARLGGWGVCHRTATTKDAKAHEIRTNRNLIGTLWPDDEI
jgi:hypothetical protein